MKKQITIYFIAFLIVSLFVPQQIKAQSPPQKMSYQAVIRDGSNALITSTTVGMQISILQTTSTGTVVYKETQTPTSNVNGLVSLEVGTGTVVSGTFSTIDWANGPFYIKTETDPLGGTTYSITGTSQLLSVPYAFYAKTAENGVTTAQAAILAATSGTNTGDQDISGIAINTAAIALNTAKIGLTPGTSLGQMLYWNGTAWIIVASGNAGQILTVINGVPSWSYNASSIPQVTNPTTGKIWMDRNLGASQVATSSTDADSYGDLYQWGRGADGHQLRTSGTTTIQSSTDIPGHGNFINTSSNYFSWRSPHNNNLWQGVNGINNPCPAGYRIPTDAELTAERLSWSSNNAVGAFASPLKLPAAGLRMAFTGQLLNVGSNGYYWSSNADAYYSNNLTFSSSSASWGNGGSASGLSVRCIKD